MIVNHTCILRGEVTTVPAFRFGFKKKFFFLTVGILFCKSLKTTLCAFKFLLINRIRITMKHSQLFIEI